MQYVAVASQKFTCPCLMSVDPADTEAVNAIIVPELMDVTGLPPAVSASDVVVPDWDDAGKHMAITTHNKSEKLSTLIRLAALHIHLLLVHFKLV